MSYHRGGHSGAVAVSYSTMSPLSPTRRCPGNAGSATSVISGTNGTATSKYTNYRSSTPSNLGSDRNGGYYSSASNAGYRASSYTSSASSDTFRRTYYSPARSVSSYNESSSIVGASSISGSGLRYGSTSTSSASSSAGSSNSSCASRDRSTHQHHTPASSAKTAAELYAIYSPTYYVPNIHGSKGSSGTSSNCRSSSSASSSGVSPSLNSELHGGDEYDFCRERRDRSYSSETSSGLGLTSNNTSTSSNNQNALLGSGNDRWSARREINKRRATPLIVTTSSSNNPITGNANKTDRTGSPTIEVTLEPVETSERSNDRFSEIGFRGHVDTESFHANPETPVNTEYPDYPKNVDINRDPDNNNVGNECASETRRRRVRRTCVEQSTANNLPSPSDEQRRRDVNDEGRTKTLERRHHDFDGNTDDSNDRERGVSKGDPRDKYRYDDHHHHQQHHQHQHYQQRNRHGEQTSVNEASSRKNDLDIPNLSSCTDNTCNDDSTLSSVARSCCVTPSSPIVQAAIRSLSSLANPIVPSPTTRSVLEEEETLVQSEPTRSRPARLKSLEDTGKRDDTKIRGDSKDRDVVDDVGAGGDAGVGGGGGVVVVVVASSADADNHRKAFTRTKIPTNNDNTELLTNNNAQDREDHLGIGETTGRKIGNEATLVGTHDPSRSRDAREMLKGTRKSLLWTATNEIDDVNDDERISKRDIDSRTNGDESVADVVNGFDNSNDQDHANDSRPYELDENAGISGGYGRNGLRSTGNRSDDVDKGSTSRRTLFGWNDPTINDITGASSSSSSSFTSSNAASSSVAAAASSSNSTNSVPVAVHQNLYRGLNEQIDEGSNSRPPRSRLQSRRDERYGLNGLRNIGNTCFMNSVIQCLSNTRPLLEYLLNEQHLQDINTTTSSMKGALIKAFGQVIQELWEMSGDHVVNTTSLKSQIQRFAPRFMGYSQQDAQEFLRYLLEGLHEDVNRVTVKPQPILTDIPDHYSDSHKATESWKRYLRSEDSTIVDVFVGQLRSSLLCTACDHVSVTLDPFWDLSLPIPMRLGTVKLNQCLEHFTKAETLDGDEKPTCSKCQMRRKCTKSFSIQKFPKILVIHLKRFSPTERFRGKLSVLVDFPLTGLDLSAFAAPGVQGCTYNLYGVANHSGTTYSGHYTAYCKHPYSGEWHEYNDSRVSTVSARSVVSSEAYVLFYEQQPPSPHL